MTQETSEGIGIALNEADWVTADVDASGSVVRLGFDVLSLPERGPMPEDPRRLLVLTGVSRVVASHRDGGWDDASAPTLPLEPRGLTGVIAEFGHLPVYGWDFVNAGDGPFDRWKDRVSFDLRCEAAGGHTMDLFQENGRRILDLRVWFDSLDVLDGHGQPIALTEFISGGVRWWDALYANDPRTHGLGIFPG
jgi:hypothetical protein